MSDKGVFIVYTDVEAKDEAAFNKWYDEIHIPDLLKLDIINGAQRFKVANAGQELRMKDGTMHTPRYVTLYFLNNGSSKAMLDTLATARPEWIAKGRLPDIFRAAQYGVYETITPRLNAPGATPTDAGVLIMYTQPQTGRDAEFNKWYDGIHAEDVLALRCVNGMQRFKGGGQEVRMRDGSLITPEYVVAVFLNTGDADQLMQELAVARPEWVKNNRTIDYFVGSAPGAYKAITQRADRPVRAREPA